LAYALRALLLVFVIALTTNLYKNASAFEKGHTVVSPDKQAFQNKVDEI
jgi:hypothetical protein